MVLNGERKEKQGNKGKRRITALYLPISISTGEKKGREKGRKEGEREGKEEGRKERN